MTSLLESAHLVDLVLAAAILEFGLISVWWRRRRQGIPPTQLLPNILAGAFLLLALRLALGGAPWHWYAGCLIGSGLAHVVDLRQRWR